MGVQIKVVKYWGGGDRLEEKVSYSGLLFQRTPKKNHNHNDAAFHLDLTDFCRNLFSLSHEKKKEKASDPIPG